MLCYSKTFLFVFVDTGAYFEYNKNTKTSTVFSTERKEVRIMIATKPMNLRANLKNYLDNAFDGEPVIVSRKNNRNVVIVSEREYNDMMKAKRNAAYMEKLQRGISALNAGKGIEHEIVEEID